MGMAHGRVVALVDQVFFGFYVIVETGFGQSQLIGDIAQRGRASALGIKKLGRPGQYGGMFRFVLDTAIEG